ncbi:MAG TPA: protein tyrosine phosphatase family protein [Polyangia bacterium]|jgi:protein tyrosine phosphatase (PTP) superfamily phosphohydrolase (DUF442 family)
MSLDDIKNFLAIDAHEGGDDRIGTAGQPTEAELAEVAGAGYQAVVNLGLLNPEYCLPDEAGLAASLGLKYSHLPVSFDAPTLADFEAFVAQMDAWANERVFVHCAANFRVSSFMAVYGELRLGWSRERADRHARTFWEPNRTWQKLIDDCRARHLPSNGAA